MTHVLYIDEAGQPRPVANRRSHVEPTFIIGGMILSAARIPSFTDAFLKLKQRYFPRLRPSGSHYLDWILSEVKGTDLKKMVRGGRDKRRHALGFLGHLLRTIADNDGRVLARVYCKKVGADINARAVYTSAVQCLCDDFNNYLEVERSEGIVIADNRNPPDNVNVAHSVFTQMFRTGSSQLQRLMEAPIFAGSDNHAGIQAADIVMSAILAPIASRAYCASVVESVHVDEMYDHIWQKLGAKLMELRYWYRDGVGRPKGGISINDPNGKGSPVLIGSPPPEGSK